MNFNKISDCILTQYLVEDMAPEADKAQYGNVQGVSVQHYFIKCCLKYFLTLVNAGYFFEEITRGGAQTSAPPKIPFIS